MFSISLSDRCLLQWKNSKSFLLWEFRNRLVWRQLQTLWTCGGVLQHCKPCNFIMHHIYCTCSITSNYCHCFHFWMIDWLIVDVSPADEQLYFLYYISSHALPSASVCKGEESINPHGLDHDDICWSVALYFFLFQIHVGLCRSYHFRHTESLIWFRSGPKYTSGGHQCCNIKQ